MSLPRTPTKQKEQIPSAFTDLSGTILVNQQQTGQSEQQQREGNSKKKTGMQKLGAGEAEATSMLSLEEKLVVQMERSMGMMAETMAKMQFDFQERMLKENGIWKSEMEKLITNSRDNINGNPLTQAPNIAVREQNAAAGTTDHSNQAPVMNPPPVQTVTTPSATEIAASRNPATTTSLLMLTPPTHRPVRPRAITQAEYARGDTNDRDSSEDEFHTTRRLEPRRAILRPPARTNHNQNVQLDRWGICFDGDDEKVPVEEFIFRVEHLQQLHDIPWGIIMGDFHKILKGKAQDWYWMHLRNHGIHSWHTFKAAMVKQFKTHRSDFDIMKQLVERKQRHNEEVEDFIHQIRKLHARLTSPMDEEELVNVIKGNMNEEIARILYPMDIKSLPELCKEYHKVQRIFVKRRHFQQPISNYQRPNRPIVSEILADENELQEEEEGVYEPNVDELKRLPPKCWNCQEVGHTYMECGKARTIFCYKCGRPQTITPRCPKCNPGNSIRGPIAASNSSSVEQQQQ